jgi:hypothetical protein
MKEVWLRAAPGLSGQLYLALDNAGDSASGLYKITGGTSITKISGVGQARKLGLGKPASGQTQPTVFVLGKTGGAATEALWRSDNGAASWTKAYDQDVQKQGALADARVIEGDRQVAGRFYTGTGGRGIWVGEPGSTGSANVRGGTWSCRASLTSTAWTANLWQYVTVAPNTSYTASVWVKGTGSLQLRIYSDFWGTQITSKQINATGTWTQHALTFSSGSNSRVVFNLTDAYGTPGTMYLDDIAVTPGGTLTNPGFESGISGWTTTGSVFTAVQNP